MKVMFKGLKKPIAFMLVLMMLFSLQFTVFATTYPISATVEFYNGTTQLWTIQNVSFNADPSKQYLPSGYTDTLAGAPSVYDAILQAVDASHLNKSTVVGWDSVSTPQGGYISTVDTYATTNTYLEEDGVHISYGYGWNAYINGNPAYSYLTSVGLQNGDEIEFKYEYYYYEW